MTEEQPQAPAPKEGGGARPPAWKRLHVRIAAVSALLVAVVGLFNLVPQVVRSGEEAVRVLASLVGLGKGPSLPYQVDMKVLKVLPHHLLHQIGAYDFLNWFALEVRNDGPEPLHLVIDVVVVAGPAEPGKIRIAEYTVEPGGVRDERLNLPIRLLLSEFTSEQHLTLTWRVSTEQQIPLIRDTRVVSVLPKTTVVWDLHGPDGRRVPPAFLLASLSAWVLTPDTEMKSLAGALVEQVLGEVDPHLRYHPWLRLAYKRLFDASAGVSVEPDPRGFPPQGRQRIRSPSDTLRRGRASPLEVALLFASLKSAAWPDIQGRLALFAVPVASGVPEGQVFLLGWPNEKGTWRAIELNQVGRLRFEQNEAQASLRLAEILAGRREITDALDTSGVFLDPSAHLAALDFWYAAREYGIRHLP